MKYNYQMCVEQGVVPDEPLLAASGESLNKLIQEIIKHPFCSHWYYWNDKSGEYEHFELSELKFDDGTEYDLRQLGWFEWADCVWNEPLLFAYNKWMHTGDPNPSFLSALWRQQNGM